MSESDVQIGKRLAILRKVAGLSQNELATKHGTCHTTLRRYERGETAIPVSFVQTVYQLAEQARPGAFALDWVLFGTGQIGVGEVERPSKAHVAAQLSSPLLESALSQPGEVTDLLAEQQLAAAESLHKAHIEARRPFVLLKPQLFADGGSWCALYGKDIQEGVAGFGDTPEEAALAFDVAWRTGRASGAQLKRRCVS